MLKAIGVSNFYPDRLADFAFFIKIPPMVNQIEPHVLNQRMENSDFTGKTVISFCTSSSLGLGESGTKLVAMAGTGNWQEREDTF